MIRPIERALYRRYNHFPSQATLEQHGIVRGNLVHWERTGEQHRIHEVDSLAATVGPYTASATALLNDVRMGNVEILKPDGTPFRNNPPLILLPIAAYLIFDLARVIARRMRT